MEGKLNKLTITAYPNSEFNDNEEGEVFTTLINPESISVKKSVEYIDNQASGTSSTDPKFNQIIAPTLDLRIIFDSTGVLAYTPKKMVSGKEVFQPVSEQIKDFEKVVLSYHGENHKPNSLQVLWGDLLFNGVAGSINYEYKLFNADGTPLRATAKLIIKASVDEVLRASDEDAESPDLTHVRSVVDGDTLPLLTKSIYGDSKYYLEVAKVNNLTNFRKLTPGRELFFPPIEKLSK